MTDHWNYFDFHNTKSEAIARLKEARDHHQNSREKDTLEYWIAWAAHANAMAVATLIERSGDNVNLKELLYRKERDPMIDIEDIKILKLEPGAMLVVQLNTFISSDIQERVREKFENEAPMLKGRLIIIDKSVSFSVVEVKE